MQGRELHTPPGCQGRTAQIPHLRHSRERRPLHNRPSRAGRPLHNRPSREGENPSPTGRATMTPEAVRHAARPNGVGNPGEIGPRPGPILTVDSTIFEMWTPAPASPVHHRTGLYSMSYDMRNLCRLTVQSWWGRATLTRCVRLQTPVRPPSAKQVSAATTRIEVDLPAPGFRLGGRNDDFPLLVRQILRRREHRNPQGAAPHRHARERGHPDSGGRSSHQV